MQINESVFVIAGIFLVLILVLNQFIFKPLVAVLDERRKKIEDGAQAQADAQHTVEASLAAYDKALMEARQKAQAQRQEMLKETESSRQEMVDAAREEAKARMSEAGQTLADQVAAARTSLEAETGAMAQRIVATLLSR
jgi:F-type H+-transporting ATPase subunit b